MNVEVIVRIDGGQVGTMNQLHSGQSVEIERPIQSEAARQLRFAPIPQRSEVTFWPKNTDV